jgi:flotillin
MTAASMPLALAFITGKALGALFAIALVALVLLALVLRSVLHLCQPNEVLVFSGRRRRTRDGKLRGYRIIRGGRAFRMPLFETVDRMDLTNMIIDVTVRNAYSKGGIPLSVQGVANIKVPGEEPLLNNCLERFLGKPRQEIMKMARETLEGNLRGVLATLTPEQVNQDKESFATQLAAEAEHDFNRLGLVLDTLKIQNVSDEVGYLDAIGRARSAEIRRDAQIAEAEAQAEAAEHKWRNVMAGEVAKLDAGIQIAIKENERRVADATTRRAAWIAQQQAEVQAQVAQAKAEVEMQDARIEQTRLRLQADVIQPAEATRRQAEETAKGKAAKIVEQGSATAKVLTNLAATYKQSGTSGRDVLLMQKLIPLLAELTSAMTNLKVDRFTVLGQGGNGAGNGSSALAGKLVSYGEQIKAATGIDVTRLLHDRLLAQGAASEAVPGGTQPGFRPPTAPQ